MRFAPENVEENRNRIGRGRSEEPGSFPGFIARDGQERAHGEPSRKQAQGRCGPQPQARTRPCAP